MIEERTRAPVGIWSIHEADPQDDQVETVRDAVRFFFKSQEKCELFYSGEHSEGLMPPRSSNTVRFDVLLFVVRALSGGLVERVLQPDIGLNLPLRGFKGDHPCDLARSIDLNLRYE